MSLLPFSSVGCYFSQSGHFFILCPLFLGRSHPSLLPAASLVPVTVPTLTLCPSPRAPALHTSLKDIFNN